MFHLRDSYSVTIKNEKLTFTNADLLNLKTIENPVAKGQFVGGRLLLTVPGDRTAQINSLQHVINVECEDYLGRISTGGYIPDSKPLTSLVIYHTEKVELAMQPESASYTPQLRSGEGEA